MEFLCRNKKPSDNGSHKPQEETQSWTLKLIRLCKDNAGGERMWNWATVQKLQEEVLIHAHTKVVLQRKLYFRAAQWLSTLYGAVLQTNKRGIPVLQIFYLGAEVIYIDYKRVQPDYTT